MIETDPIHEVERALADELRRANHRELGLTAQTQVHFRDDTLVCLVESDEFPEPTPSVRAAMEGAVAEFVDRLLGREVQRPVVTTRPSPNLLLAVIRLI